jgi:protein involved in polysaccharide export with SLBB domain
MSRTEGRATIAQRCALLSKSFVAIAGSTVELATARALVLIALCSACSEVASNPHGNGPNRSIAGRRELPAQAVDTRPSVTASADIETNATPDLSGSDKLGALQQSRSLIEASRDFPIGAGDVIEISAPDIEELKDRTVRVSADNTIGLPLIGVMEVGGMTEEQLREALRLSLRRYMFNPQPEVFVKEYRTRQIAISGAVKNPGVYTLASPSDTVLEMISRAGGMTEDASQRIVLIPGAPSAKVSLPVQSLNANASSGVSHPEQVASLGLVLTGFPLRAGSGPSNARGPDSTRLTVKSDLDPIVIDVNDISNQKLLDLPARPGDVVIVPPAGQVVVQGWVQNPGAYKITSGMTALGAVGAAGGALFSTSAEILRTNNSGARINLPVDLSNGQNGKNAALPVQAGDVLVVNRSVTGSIPYFFYLVFSKFGTGMYIPLP